MISNKDVFFQMWLYSPSLGLVLSCVILTVPVSTKGDFTRKVHVIYNPGCNITDCKGNGTLNVIYARAQGPNDTLHYIVSTAGPSSPTILLLRTDVVTATLKIEWKSFSGDSLKELSGAVALVSNTTGEPVASNVESVIIVDRVLQFNDSTDTAVFNVSTLIEPQILLKQLNWEVLTNGDTAQLLGTSGNISSFTANSSISFKFTPYGCSGQADELPSLPYNGNTSGWEINLSSLLSNQSGSRYAIETLLLGVGSSTSKISTKSIDDEYAPAAFITEKVEWLQNGTTKQDKVLTFFNWRAVGYTAPQHSRSTVTDVKTDSIVILNRTTEQVQSVYRNRLLTAYFGESKLKSLNVKSVIFSFGQPEDGYYAASNYTSWSSTIGFGDPPKDQFSTLVLCMLIIGVGGPLLVIIFGGCYVGHVRIKRSRKALQTQVMTTNYDYQPIEK